MTARVQLVLHAKDAESEIIDQHKYMEYFNIIPSTTEDHVSGQWLLHSWDWRALEYRFKVSSFDLQNYLNCLLKRYNESVAAEHCPQSQRRITAEDMASATLMNSLAAVHHVQPH